MTFDTVHIFSLLNATEIDSKSLAHHARNAEAILEKIPNELQKLIFLHSVAGSHDKDGEKTELQRKINELFSSSKRSSSLSPFCCKFAEHENVAATLVKLRWCISQTEEERGLLSARVHTLEAFNHKLDADIERLSGCTYVIFHITYCATGGSK
ncbi:hypothetical protein FBUS_06362 [Fasciolopsis buskii]|uniref:Uncharacterized protein n=1 Tax=Fasciolopsis buskii TaxID=27845 RepID=A0A8E0RP33_9TREM|nr:hypothetical protein FBUS_06362 [Fasciolopsis buski]